MIGRRVAPPSGSTVNPYTVSEVLSRTVALPMTFINISRVPPAFLFHVVRVACYT